MKKKIYLLILAFVVFFSLIGCTGKTEETKPTDRPIIDNVEQPNNPNPDDPDNPNVETPGDEEVEFVASLKYEDELFIPQEEIKVIWYNKFSQKSESIASDGYAKTKGLDGEYSVHLNNAPEGYTYNPNIYTVDNENPIVVIELISISKIRRGSGKDLYERAYKMDDTGTYRATFSTSNVQVLYYEFEPKKSGVYLLESLVDIYDDTINPIADIHVGTKAYKNPTPQATVDSGGPSKLGGYTKNFRWEYYIDEKELNNVFSFGIKVESKTGEWPIYVDFTIKYIGEYSYELPKSIWMEAKETEIAVAKESTGAGYTYVNADKNTGILNGKWYKYDEETKLWRCYDEKTDTYGAFLCVKITKPSAFIDEAFNLIESHGNKNLTVSEGKENYKRFIEVQYAAICNDDGACYVTMELKEFLQKYSISQRLFMDGEGFVEGAGAYATEEDQWLFACGYYIKNE